MKTGEARAVWIATSPHGKGVEGLLRIWQALTP
jgi:hypothetical protein